MGKVVSIKFNNTNTSSSSQLGANYDIVDGNVDKLDEETNEAHESESNGGRYRYLLELLSVWFSALFDEADRVLGDLLQGFELVNNLIHGVEVGRFDVTRSGWMRNVTETMSVGTWPGVVV